MGQHGTTHVGPHRVPYDGTPRDYSCWDHMGLQMLRQHQVKELPMLRPHGATQEGTHGAPYDGTTEVLMLGQHGTTQVGTHGAPYNGTKRDYSCRDSRGSLWFDHTGLLM